MVMNGATNALVERLQAAGRTSRRSGGLLLELRWPHDDAQERALREAVAEADRDRPPALPRGRTPGGGRHGGPPRPG